MKFRRTLLVFGGLLALPIATLFAGLPLAAASDDAAIYFFPPNGSDTAGVPSGNLVADSAGNLYGTTTSCGGSCAGDVYELIRPVAPSTQWTRTVLYTFTDASSGVSPRAGVIFDAAGNLYGTALAGGSFGSGAVFKLTPPTVAGGSWTESVIYSFQGSPSDGANPRGGLIFDNLGNLYGVTSEGGIASSSNRLCRSEGCGIVFELSPPATEGAAWTETVLHFFNGAQGYDAIGAPVFDAKGNLYGGTVAGGANSGGVIYKLAPPATAGAAWVYKVLYDFYSSPADGYEVYGSLTLHGPGDLYGTTYYGGPDGGNGTVFELTPPTVTGGAWTENILYTFRSTADGRGPQSNVIFDKSGNIYGTTLDGVIDGCDIYSGSCGIVYQLAPPASAGANWTENILHAFPTVAVDGVEPSSGVIFGKNGVLFGATYSGGTDGWGTVYRVVP